MWSCEIASGFTVSRRALSF